MSKLIQKDIYTEQSYAADGFNPATNTSEYSYTSGRVAQRVYNKYNTANKPKLFGYYTDWAHYDQRQIDNNGNILKANRGRGIDITKLDPTAYDKIIFGFTGIVGDQGDNKAKIEQAARQTLKKTNEMTILDPWGDCQSYINCGFSGWKAFGFGPGSVGSDTEEDCFYQDHPNLQGVLGAMRDLQKKAKAQGHDLALSFSLGGWTMSDAFHELAKSQSAIDTLVASIIDFFKRFPMFSEIDIDWEYPNAPGAGNPHGPEDGENYAVLIDTLNKALKANGLSHVKISIASSANVEVLQHSNIKGLLEVGLYGINLMTYDFFGTPWADGLGHHANLYKTENTTYSLEEAVEYLLNLGVDPEAINIGYAGYSRSAKGGEISSFSPLKGSYDGNGTTVGTFESGCVEWYDIINNYLDLENKSGRNGYNVYTDDEACADYLYSPTSKVFHSIDTPRTVREKARYVIEKGLGGLFTWTIDNDNGLLVNAGREGMGCPIVQQNIDMSPFYFKGINIEGEQPVDPVEPVDPVDPVEPEDETAPTAVITMKAQGGSTLVFSADKSSKAASYKWSNSGNVQIVSPQASETNVVLPVVTAETVVEVLLTVTAANKKTDMASYKVVIAPASSAPVDPVDPVDPVEPVDPVNPDAPSDYPQWSATATYVEGSKVTHKGVNYIGKFWSQGSEPGLEETTGQYGKPWDYLR
ncbi:glycosyl hydrolase family 18 protein [Kalamiella sp. sgz302252]|uniref:glycosyl hydrolase family 18 protein n=1 Tax=Pantoea sp. sgz302252 TaxID=3341827 RepID=UPI0036D30569